MTLDQGDHDMEFVYRDRWDKYIPANPQPRYRFDPTTNMWIKREDRIRDEWLRDAWLRSWSQGGSISFEMANETDTWPNPYNDESSNTECEQECFEEIKLYFDELRRANGSEKEG